MQFSSLAWDLRLHCSASCCCNASEPNIATRSHLASRSGRNIFIYFYEATSQSYLIYFAFNHLCLVGACPNSSSVPLGECARAFGTCDTTWPWRGKSEQEGVLLRRGSGRDSTTSNPEWSPLLRPPRYALTRRCPASCSRALPWTPSPGNRMVHT